MKSHPDYPKLSPEEKAKICNGCGPAGWKGMLVPDNLLGLCITEECNPHDHRYYIGGTEEDRKIADREFLENLLDRIEDNTEDHLLLETRRELAFIYYCSVRDHGKSYFSYH